MDYQTVIIEGTFNIEIFQKTLDQFDQLSEDMNKHASDQPLIFEPSVGQACCTEYADDGKWYRGEIYSTDMLPMGKVEVLFVDYGNLDLVPRDAIRMLKKEWVEYPVQQLKCKLHGVQKADNISVEEATKYMTDFLLDKRFLVIVKKIKPELHANLLHLESMDLAYSEAINDGKFILKQ